MQANHEETEAFEVASLVASSDMPVGADPVWPQAPAAGSDAGEDVIHRFLKNSGRLGLSCRGDGGIPTTGGRRFAARPELRAIKST